MKTKQFIGVLLAVSMIFMAGRVSAITLGFVPVSQSTMVGSQVDVALNISGQADKITNDGVTVGKLYRFPGTCSVYSGYLVFRK